MRRAQPPIAILLTLCCAATLACSKPEEPAPPPPDARPLVGWNQLVLAVAEAEDGFLTLKGLRTATMMHLAVHDALNAIEPRYESYISGEPDLPAESAADADPLAAVVAAATAIAVHEYPDNAERFETEGAAWLQATPSGEARERGRALGRASAQRVLAERAGDGWDAEAQYQWHPMGPGVYADFAEHSGTPEGFIFGAGWAAARPFTLDNPGQFRAPPPPDIASAEYTAAFEEVKSVGRHESETRTEDQAHLAMWWKDFAENSHNRLARQLVVAESLDLWDAARLFALLNMSLYDAYINVFENKFLYNHWRPYTAIRWAANDGNPSTEPDEGWDNLHRHTYAFPSYPSAHGTACAAAMAAMEDTFGTGYAFTMTTNEIDIAGPFSGKVAMEPPTRSFDDFSSAAMECALSRIYLGIHFRYDSEAGNVLGSRIGEHVTSRFLRPLGP